MNKIFTIVKKELKRYFTDKRTLISLILPGLLIFVLYNVMGNVLTETLSGNTHVYQVYVNDENLAKNIYDGAPYNVKIKSDLSTTDAKEKVNNGEIDLYIEYEEGFQTKISNGEIPSVDLYYASSNNTSIEIFNYTLAIMQSTANTITPIYTINNSDKTYDLNPATAEDTSRMFIKMMMPFLLVIFLFSGCMAISTEAIAGEKERGTIYTLLVTPTKRSQIAIGKILALSIVSLVSASFSFIGTILSLPKLVGGETNVTLSIYGFGDYMAIFAVILVTVIFFTSVLLLLSSYARSIKEAGQLALVVMIPTMLMGVTSMIGPSDNIATSFIPIYNSITTMSNVFAGTINYLYFALTIIANIVFISLIIFLLTKMFNSEKIMRSN